jgi:hypothetical protein
MQRVHARHQRVDVFRSVATHIASYRNLGRSSVQQ